MVSAETAQQLAMALPGTELYNHFGKPAFRANGRTFATLWVAENRMMIKLSLIDQSVFADFNRAVIYPVPNKWGLQGCTFFELKNVRQDMLADALNTAYNTVMTMKPSKNRPKAK